MNCSGQNSCKGMTRTGSDNPDSMKLKRKDLIATPKFKKVMGEYGQGTLRTPNGQQVNSPKQAEAIAASESGQSYNQQARKFKNSDRYGTRAWKATRPKRARLPQRWRSK